MQELKLPGRVGKVGDIKVLTEKNNLVVLPFSLATDGFYDKDSGETETHWLNFTAFNKDAEIIADNVQPGDIVEVKFQIVNDIQNVGGTNVHGYKLRLLDFKFLHLKKWENQGN